METLVLFFLFLLFSFTRPVVRGDRCSTASCDSVHGPIIRFPFRLTGKQPARCGYPGFDLSCNNQNQTILSLPLTGEFVVDYIDYSEQAILINDPDRCNPRKILNFSLSGSPFEVTFTRKYNFFNCSSSDGLEYMSYDLLPLSCLSGENYTVVATPSYSIAQQIPPSCRKISSVSFPSQRYVSQYWSSMDLRDDFQLTWNEPGCRSCVAKGGICGFKGNTVLEVGCSRPPNRGLPRSAKYGIIIGVVIPGLLCLIGLACVIFGRIRAFSHRGRLNSSELPTITISQQPVVRVAGLDGPTIASYPKTLLGESRRLPNPSDGTCPICLSDYEPKETLRSIPECNHYFHANCIDEWLKLNGTCPVCRNSPESSIGTPWSSMSSPYSLSSLDHH